MTLLTSLFIVWFIFRHFIILAMHTSFYIRDNEFRQRLKRLASLQNRSVNKLILDAVGSYVNQKYKQTLDSYTKDNGSEPINIPTIYDDRKTMVKKWNAISTDDLLSIDHRVVMFEDTYRKILRGKNNV